MVLAAPVPEVWRAVAEPDRLATWLGGRVELEGRTGGRVALSDETGEHWGTVECYEPARLLVLRLWERSSELRGTRLKFSLDVAEGGTRLTVVEERIGTAGDHGASRATASAGRGG